MRIRADMRVDLCRLLVGLLVFRYSTFFQASFWKFWLRCRIVLVYLCHFFLVNHPACPSRPFRHKYERLTLRSSLYLPNPIYHQIAFAFILISAVVRNIFLIQRVPQGHPIIAHVTRTMAWGVLTFAGGFTIWNIDNIFCTQLRAVRESIGWMGFLLEGEQVPLDGGG